MRWLLLASLLSFAGCKQGEGDRCQVQADCDDNLICVLPAGGTPQSGGTCQLPGSLNADLASPTDAAADL
jgi:hypothetical protein